MATNLFDPIKTQAKVTDSVIVAFSGGKDSIVTLDLCFRYFENVHPFFMYICPNLEFQERTLQWYEEKYQTEITRLPHFEVSNFLRYGTFRAPNPYVPIVSVTDVYSYMREETGACWIAAGERAADSIVRNAMIKNSGSIDRKRGRFYPVAWWKKREIMAYIKRHRLKLPEDSRRIGYSFRSLAGRELEQVKKAFPADYEKILRLYPFADAAVEHWRAYGW